MPWAPARDARSRASRARPLSGAAAWLFAAAAGRLLRMAGAWAQGPALSGEKMPPCASRSRRFRRSPSWRLRARACVRAAPYMPADLRLPAPSTTLPWRGFPETTRFWPLAWPSWRRAVGKAARRPAGPLLGGASPAPRARPWVRTSRRRSPFRNWRRPAGRRRPS